MAVLNPKAYRRFAADMALKRLQDSDMASYKFRSGEGFTVRARRLKKGLQVTIMEDT